jgi:DNA-binding NtrC family response regulator
MVRVFRRSTAQAREMPVLITGETGTGKGWLPGRSTDQPRAKGPFFAIPARRCRSSFESVSEFG